MEGSVADIRMECNHGAEKFFFVGRCCCIKGIVRELRRRKNIIRKRKSGIHRTSDSYRNRFRMHFMPRELCQNTAFRIEKGLMAGEFMGWRLFLCSAAQSKSGKEGKRK